MADNFLDSHAHPWTNMFSHFWDVSSIQKLKNQSTSEWAFWPSASKLQSLSVG